MRAWIFLFICMSGGVSRCIASRILSLMPFPGKSHYINIQPIMQQLALRGHDVTVVTTHYEKNPLPNYHQIILDNKTFWDSFGPKHDKFTLEHVAFTKEMKIVWDGAYFTTEVAFNSTSLQEFIENDNSHFDLVIVELFFQEAFYMFAHKYNAPIVTISTMGFTQYLGDAMGNPLQLAYMPHEFLPKKGKMNVWKRLENMFYTMYDIVGRRYYMLPRHERLLSKHFKNLPGPWPSLLDLERRVSVALINTHYSIDTVRPHVPGIIEIGGVHIKSPKNLTKDLQTFIDESTHGVVFFSLGSNLKSKDMPKEKVNMFLRVFSKLKQRVLWKWEDDDMKGKPDNVFTGAWLPQTDILAHPNVRAFITHGGLLSTLEAVHFGVPIIGIPVFGDQHLNTAKAENLGFGVKLAFSALSEEAITKALSKVLSEPSYTNTAKELSLRFRDRQNSPMDTAIFWIEYVIRHKGAEFIRSPMLGLTWYESHMVDANLIILTFIITITLLIAMTIKFIYRKIFSKKKQANISNGKKFN